MGISFILDHNNNNHNILTTQTSDIGLQWYSCESDRALIEIRVT